MNRIHLVLFLSRATPLSRWDAAGIITREIAIYRQMRPHLQKISIVTSGGAEELRYQNRLGDINILYNRWGLSPNTYSLLAPFLHRQALQTGSLFKTNQLDGAWTAIIAGRLYRKPVIVRAGYLWAEDFDTQSKQKVKRNVIHNLQSFAFKKANHIIVTTAAIKSHIIEHDAIPAEKVTVIPNYVDTEMFCPADKRTPDEKQICFVGRLNPIKNLDRLIQAAAHFPDVSLTLVGQGKQRAELDTLARKLGVKVEFTGTVPNHKLPQIINRAAIFVLPSFSEGHPKALIEAMACGAAVIGTDVLGIRNVIRHEETGLLCPPTVEGIQAAVRRLLHDDDLRAKLGQAARTFTVQEYSLTKIVQRELTLYEKIKKSEF